MKQLENIKKQDFHYELPESNIAKFPLDKRHDSKLLVYRNGNSNTHSFSTLPELLDHDQLLVFNNAKVIPARLFFRRKTGALIEVLLLEPIKPKNYEESFHCTSTAVWKCMVGQLKKWRDEEEIEFFREDIMLTARIIDREKRWIQLRWENNMKFSDLLQIAGAIPLPPYLNREAEESDTLNYQTVFARREGSVAAPTAGLHFTPDLLHKLSKKTIAKTELTLHVGAGTFLPVKEEEVLLHHMHTEHFELDRKSLDTLIKQPRRIAVGTTVLRVLESLYYIGMQLAEKQEDLHVQKLEPYKRKDEMTYTESLHEIGNYMDRKGIERLFASTEIMILPPYRAKSIEAIITNFHLPESTLLMLISALVGNQWKNIYRYALQNDFRFLSYGDSSLLYLDHEGHCQLY